MIKETRKGKKKRLEVNKLYKCTTLMTSLFII